MAMDEVQSKAQQVRQVLLPGLQTLAKECQINGEVNLICARNGAIELTVHTRTGSDMHPLFSSAEIMDGSYKTHFRPRVEKLLKAIR